MCVICISVYMRDASGTEDSLDQIKSWEWIGNSESVPTQSLVTCTSWKEPLGIWNYFIHSDLGVGGCFLLNLHLKLCLHMFLYQGFKSHLLLTSKNQKTNCKSQCHKTQHTQPILEIPSSHYNLTWSYF